MERPTVPATVVGNARLPVRSDLPSRVCVVSLSGKLFAIDLRNIREVFVVDLVTPVPGMPPVLVGLANLRGAVVPIVDLRLMLGLPAAGSTLQYAVVIKYGGNHVGVLVDDAPEIRTVEADHVLPAPQNGPMEQRSFVSSVLRMEDRLGGVLEIPMLMAHMDIAGIGMPS
jgi:purine-binding chemotaxis protein CheW